MPSFMAEKNQHLLQPSFEKAAQAPEQTAPAFTRSYFSPLAAAKLSPPQKPEQPINVYTMSTLGPSPYFDAFTQANNVVLYQQTPGLLEHEIGHALLPPQESPTGSLFGYHVLLSGAREAAAQTVGEDAASNTPIVYRPGVFEPDLQTPIEFGPGDRQTTLYGLLNQDRQGPHTIANAYVDRSIEQRGTLHGHQNLSFYQWLTTRIEGIHNLAHLFLSIWENASNFYDLIDCSPDNVENPFGGVFSQYYELVTDFLFRLNFVNVCLMVTLDALKEMALNCFFHQGPALMVQQEHLCFEAIFVESADIRELPFEKLGAALQEKFDQLEKGITQIYNAVTILGARRSKFNRSPMSLDQVEKLINDKNDNQTIQYPNYRHSEPKGYSVLRVALDNTCAEMSTLCKAMVNLSPFATYSWLEGANADELAGKGERSNENDFENITTLKQLVQSKLFDALSIPFIKKLYEEYAFLSGDDTLLDLFWQYLCIMFPNLEDNEKGNLLIYINEMLDIYQEYEANAPDTLPSVEETIPLPDAFSLKYSHQNLTNSFELLSATYEENAQKYNKEATKLSEISSLENEEQKNLEFIKFLFDKNMKHIPALPSSNARPLTFYGLVSDLLDLRGEAYLLYILQEAEISDLQIEFINHAIPPNGPHTVAYCYLNKIAIRQIFAKISNEEPKESIQAICTPEIFKEHLTSLLLISNGSNLWQEFAKWYIETKACEYQVLYDKNWSLNTIEMLVNLNPYATYSWEFGADSEALAGKNETVVKKAYKTVSKILSSSIFDKNALRYISPDHIDGFIKYFVGLFPACTDQENLEEELRKMYTSMQRQEAQQDRNRFVLSKLDYISSIMRNFLGEFDNESRLSILMNFSRLSNISRMRVSDKSPILEFKEEDGSIPLEQNVPIPLEPNANQVQLSKHYDDTVIIHIIEQRILQFNLPAALSPTVIPPSIYNARGGYNYNHLQDYIENNENAANMHLLIPFNFNGHWIGLYLVFEEPNVTIYVIDTVLPHNTGVETAKQQAERMQANIRNIEVSILFLAQALYGPDRATVQVVNVECAPQQDTYNCGPLVAENLPLFALAIAQDRPAELVNDTSPPAMQELRDTQAALIQ